MYEFDRIDFDEAERIRKQARRDRAEIIGGALIRAVRAVFRGLGGVAQAFADAKRQHALYEELTRLTDRELRDIGINRADIPAVVAGVVTRREDRRAPAVAAAAEPVQTPAQAQAQSDERRAA